MFLTRVSILVVSTLCIVTGKIYERCELARELRNFDVPEDEIPTWVCIAQHESNYDTTAMNPGSGDHGLFQISQLFWCSPPGNGYGCNSPCSKFRDDDIADDLQCIRRIHNEHRRISGDGFTAWVVYPLHCQGDTSRYIQSCFDEESYFATQNVTENEISTEDLDEYGDGYNFPALPNVPKKHTTEKIDEGDGYEFPKLPFHKGSINDFVAVQSSSETPLERISKTLEQKSQKFAFSKTSIHDFVPVIKENPFSKFAFPESSIHDFVPVLGGKYDVPKLHFSKQSINHFIPVSNKPNDTLNTNTQQVDVSMPHAESPSEATSKKDSLFHDSVTIKEENDNFLPKFPFSKQSINHFIPVPSSTDNPPIEHAGKEAQSTTKTPFADLTSSEKPLFEDSKITAFERHHLQYKQTTDNEINYFSPFETKPTPTTAKPFLSTKSTRQYTTTEKATTSLPFSSTRKSLISSSRSPIPTVNTSTKIQFTTTKASFTKNTPSTFPRATTQTAFTSNSYTEKHELGLTSNNSVTAFKALSAIDLQSNTKLYNKTKFSYGSVKNILKAELNIATRKPPTTTSTPKLEITFDSTFTTKNPFTRTFARTTSPYVTAKKTLNTLRSSSSPKSEITFKSTFTTDNQFTKSTSIPTAPKISSTPIKLLPTSSSLTKSEVPVSITERSEFYDLEGASSTFVPFMAIIRSTTTLKPIATFKPFTVHPIQKVGVTSTVRPFISEDFGFVHLKTHAENPKPSYIQPTKKPVAAFTTLKSIYRPSTTTFKPLATFKPFIVNSPQKVNVTSPVKPFISERFGFEILKTSTESPTSSHTLPTQKPFARHFDVSTTKNPSQLFQTTPFTTIRPSTSYSFKPFTTNHSIGFPNTTQRPLQKQLTFAPDSFFSWIFNSQTLPPILPPARPSRPPGGRPGGGMGRPTTIRPIINERPSGLPRPPGGLPGPLQPHLPFNERPELGSVTTRRPFPLRPNGSRPSSSMQRPFGPPRLGNRPGRPHVEDAFKLYAKDDSLDSVKNLNEMQETSTKIPSVLNQNHKVSDAVSLQERSNAYVDDKEKTVEIKLDDHSVFVRTKYGYRLFRT